MIFELIATLSSVARVSSVATSSKIPLTKEKEGYRTTNEEEEGRRGEKSSGGTLCYYNRYSGDSFGPKNTCLTKEVHLAVTFSKSAKISTAK